MDLSLRPPNPTQTDGEVAKMEKRLGEIRKYCGETTTLSEEDRAKYRKEWSRADSTEKCLINDAIHGPIELTPLLYHIINTPEFHRLRHIKQLGAANYVYPGANHTRLDHSIGVYYLAGEFAKSLKEKMEKDKKHVQEDEWNFKDKEIICAQVAGLCHDLGHGPFSHMFECMVMKELLTAADGTITKVEHEELSVAIFKRLLVKNMKVLAQFVKANLGLDEVKIIEKMIYPPEKDTTEKRMFLYEIVANKRTGIDVDKWDYYARDCHYLGVTHDFQWRRCMKLGRVVRTKSDEGKIVFRIAFRDKEMDNLYGMFRIRANLHQKAYQHKTSKAVERMISDAMIAAKDFEIIGVPSSSEAAMTIQAAVRSVVECKKTTPDPECSVGYLALTDCVLSTIKGAAFLREESDAKVAEVRKIIERIEKRDLYYLSAKVRVVKPDKRSDSELQHRIEQHLPETTESVSHAKCAPWEIVEELMKNPEKLETKIHEKLELNEKQRIKKDHIWAQIVRFKLASEKQDDPVKEVLFYKKPNGEEPIEVLSKEQKERLPSMLAVPKAFVEYEVRLYDKREASERESGDSVALQNALDSWKDNLSQQELEFESSQAKASK